MTPTYRPIKPPRRRKCPMCDNLGFRRIGFDYCQRPIFACNACHHEWTEERGPIEGTKRT